MNNYEEREIEIDIVELARYLWKHILVILVAFVVMAGAGFIGSKFIMTPMYESTSMICITGTGGGAVQSMLAELQAGSALTADYQILTVSRPVVERVIDDLRLDMNYDDLKGRIRTENPTNTRILSFTVEDEDPDMAKMIVDDLTGVMITQVAEIMRTDEPTIVQKGDVPEFPSSPRTLRNTFIAGLLGLIISIGVLIISYLSNDTIKTPEDIENYLGLNTLGTIPLAKGARKNTRKSGRFSLNQRRKY